MWTSRVASSFEGEVRAIRCESGRPGLIKRKEIWASLSKYGLWRYAQQRTFLKSCWCSPDWKEVQKYFQHELAFPLFAQGMRISQRTSERIWDHRRTFMLEWEVLCLVTFKYCILAQEPHSMCITYRHVSIIVIIAHKVIFSFVLLLILLIWLSGVN